MILTQFLEAGISDSQSSHLQKKIRNSNGAALLAVPLVILPFVVISFVHLPPLRLIPVIGLFITLATIGLNALGAVTLGRIVMALSLPGLVCLFHIGLASANAPLIASASVIQVSFSVIVFLVFDLRERATLFAIASLVLATIILTHYAKGWWEPTVDAAVFQGSVGVIATVSGALSVFAAVFVLIYQNQRSEEKSSQFLAEAEQNYRKMRETEQELKANLQQLEAAQQEEQQRQWISDGLTKINSLLRDYDDQQTMGEEILSKIIHYVKANQGGLFLVEEENSQPSLKLQACYAYERKKYLKKKVNIGEGLLGQAYLERAPIYLTDLPENYVNITSGLGETPPRCLLIVPLVVNDEVEGVLELASFQPFEPHQIEFIKTVSQSVAATIRSMRVNEQTKILLEASQQQANEVRAQEEEIRQNLEEMQATQEQSDRFRAELEESHRLLQEKLRELKVAQEETEEVRQIERQRAQEQIASRTVMMQKVTEKFKQKEQQLLAEIQKLTTQPD